MPTRSGQFGFWLRQHKPCGADVRRKRAHLTFLQLEKVETARCAACAAFRSGATFAVSVGARCRCSARADTGEDIAARCPHQKLRCIRRKGAGQIYLALVILSRVLTWQGFASPEAANVTMEYVAQKAEERARKPYHSAKGNLPDFLHADQLDYDNYREIEFRPDQALWARDRLPFRVEFFHPGYLYQEPVRINEFSPTHVQPIRFVQDFFDYRKLTFSKQIPADAGYAGFRVLSPFNQPDKFDELGAFLGASYFRLLGRGQRYGASARGLALNCGYTNRTEEFPVFTDWWLGKPSPEDKDLHLFAILDSVSCTGAYEFHVRPGETTMARIEAIIFLRTPENIQAADPHHQTGLTYGFVPLTSMFWFTEGSERKFDDYRPAVHDSDGLLIGTEDGEFLWRPLVNPTATRHQQFAFKNIHGFGLLQRERAATSYQDLFNPYQLAPSIWVEPMGQWGEGQVHLVQLNTQSEGSDNIVAFWEPKFPPQSLQGFHFGCLMFWTMEADKKLSENKVLATRIGADPRKSQVRDMAIDFAGPKLAALAPGVVPQLDASCSQNGTFVDQQVFPILGNGGWRVILKMEPKPGNKDAVEIRCRLKNGEEALSETWNYSWSPQ